ncbi:hypothetical protein A1L58_08500 [Shewanella baltica]|uniref:glycosyltransferase n=1 Tax=Shewanella baltica TaxID=62322 RepID=UPI0007B4DCE1|nr:glycosyltransferase [Shewanella baltica]KZK65184.1 hypothetical protein A1L58_08500 [Shewanella baltica]
MKPKESVVLIFKDDGNEGSNNSARRISEIIKSNGGKVTNIFLKKNSAKNVLYKKYKSIYLNHSRLRKNNPFQTIVSSFFSSWSVYSLFSSLRKRKVVINNATLIDLVFLSLISKHETYVFLREVHLPKLFIKAIMFFERNMKLNILSNNLAIREYYDFLNLKIVNNFVEIPSISINYHEQVESLRIMSVGAIYPLKNQLKLLEIAKKLKVLKIPFKIDFYGSVLDSVYYAKLVDYLENNELEDCINFKGAVNNEVLLSHYSNYNVYIQTSTSEGMSRSLMDALAIGQYCIATDVGDTSLLISPDKGLLVSKDITDIEQIRILQKLFDIYSEPSTVKSEVDLGRENIRINFSSEAVCRQLKHVGLL